MISPRSAQVSTVLMSAAFAAALAIVVCDPAVAEGAVVMDLDAASKSKLPSVESLKTGKSSLVQPFRSADLNVASDPTGRIVAVWTPKHPGKQLPPPPNTNPIFISLLY